jgi:hypothetical protein
MSVRGVAGPVGSMQPVELCKSVTAHRVSTGPDGGHNRLPFWNLHTVEKAIKKFNYFWDK